MDEERKNRKFVKFPFKSFLFPFGKPVASLGNHAFWVSGDLRFGEVTSQVASHLFSLKGAPLQGIKGDFFRIFRILR